MKINKKLSYNASVRWDGDLPAKVEKWFEKNPGWTVSRLVNQAVRYFVLVRFPTEPIQIIQKINEKSEII